MSASGVGVNDNCLTTYQKLKLGKKLKFIIYSLNSTNTEIVVDKESDSLDYDDFVAALPEDQCRYAIYDFQFEVEGGQRNKLTFFTWSPDNAKIKNKMIYASSKDSLRRALIGIAADIQGTDFDEIAYETVLDKVSRSH